MSARDKLAFRVTSPPADASIGCDRVIAFPSGDDWSKAIIRLDSPTGHYLGSFPASKLLRMADAIRRRTAKRRG